MYKHTEKKNQAGMNRSQENMASGIRHNTHGRKVQKAHGVNVTGSQRQRRTAACLPLQRIQQRWRSVAAAGVPLKAHVTRNGNPRQEQ
jgi:hypothetical protein